MITVISVAAKIFIVKALHKQKYQLLLRQEELTFKTQLPKHKNTFFAPVSEDLGYPCQLG